MGDCHLVVQKRGAADAILLWNKAGGRVLAGLERRRAAERALFLIPVTSHSSPTKQNPLAALLAFILSLFRKNSA